MAENNGAGFVAPYVGFGTFKNFIGKLGENHMPPQIDASLIKGQSGGTQAALLVAMKSLGLIDDDGNVQDELRSLASAHGTKKWATEFRGVLLAAYDEVISAVPLENGTAKQLEDAFRAKTSLSGSTLRKAIGFFLRALQDAEVPLSPHFRAPKTTSAPKRPRAAKGKTGRPTGSSGSSGSEGDSGGSETPPAIHAFAKDVLGKIPEFDPSWPAEVQTKWFDALQRAMALTTGSKERPAS